MDEQVVEAKRRGLYFRETSYDGDFADKLNHTTSKSI